MSKIKFSLIDSYISDLNLYVLTFIIHEQDLEHRAGFDFVSSNGIVLKTTHYNFLQETAIYLNSKRNWSDADKGFSSENTSRKFGTKDELIAYKERLITAIKEWSNYK